MRLKKQPFDIDLALARIREAVADYPKAALFELAEEGYDSPFELLLACILSIRTYDEVTLPCARRLFERARTPAAVRALSPDQIDALIRESTFHEAKARQLHEIARRVEVDYGGTLPCDEAVLRSFKGVGPKCANLVLGMACGDAKIGVDVHVHRVTNRWGYVDQPNPTGTMHALEKILPEAYRVEINRLLVPFGKHICTGRRPRCSTCPVRDMCEQVGVEHPR